MGKSSRIEACFFARASSPLLESALSNPAESGRERIHRLDEKRGTHYSIRYDIWKVGGKQIVGHGGARRGRATLHDFLQETGRFRAPRKPSGSLSRYEGRFSSRWDGTIVVKADGRLVAFAPQDERPMDDSVILDLIGDHAFGIASGSECGYLGEKATFRFGRNRRLVGLSWGRTRW